MSRSTAISVAPPAQLPMTRRKRTPFLIAGLSAAAVLVSGAWYLLHLGRESTDDAQVEGHVTSVSPRVAGQVLRVRVEDNQVVDAGEVLVELDPADPGLLESLREWRLRASNGKPAYTVAHNSTLESIARLRPQSLNELAGIKGVGPAFVKRHGEDPVERLVTELGPAWGDRQQSRLARWPVAMRVGRIR